jgi:hypothetical protein
MSIIETIVAGTFANTEQSICIAQGSYYSNPNATFLLWVAVLLLVILAFSIALLTQRKQVADSPVNIGAMDQKT